MSKLVDVLLDMSEWKYVASVEWFEEVFLRIRRGCTG